MTKVFVSYSRKDAVFARHLVQALEDAGYESWVDWSSIPYSADWWEEICLGVEAADSFVTILTPDSLSSKVCNLEIEYALKHNKRVIPVVYRDVMVQEKPLPEIVQSWFKEEWRSTAEENWTHLTHRQWLFFRETETFEESFAKLIHASIQDLEHVKAHTRLLLWAREWERNQRNPSSLLRGDDLRTAENWLAYSSNKAPPPNDIHRQYIVQSRLVEDTLHHQETQREQLVRRFRITAGVAAIIGILAVLATLFAVSQTANAISQAATATVEQGLALELGRQAQASATHLADDAAYFALQQQRVATLAAGAVVVPPGSSTPEPTAFVNALTEIAVMNAWEVVQMQDEFGVEMVQVPSGCFYMGSVAAADEQPITLQCFTEPFWIDKYEVTQGQFTNLGGVMTGTIVFAGTHRPVANINWFEARDYCRDRRNARLPTEREWEYAARGPDSLMYPWGNLFVSENVEYGRGDGEGPADVINADGSPARPNGASWVGAMDLVGNAYEWVNTRYDDLDLISSGATGFPLIFEDVYPYPYRADDGREEDESIDQFYNKLLNSQLYTLRVVRGGSWDYTFTILRGSARDWFYPDNGFNIGGFRCARSD